MLRVSASSCAVHSVTQLCVFLHLLLLLLDLLTYLSSLSPSCWSESTDSCVCVCVCVCFSDTGTGFVNAFNFFFFSSSGFFVCVFVCVFFCVFLLLCVFLCLFLLLLLLLPPLCSVAPVMMASKPLVEDVVAAAVSAGIQTSQEAVAFALGFATAMSAPAMDTAPFKIYYHDGFSGRAQSLFLLFADAGLEYERKSKGDVTDVRCVSCKDHCSCS